MRKLYKNILVCATAAVLAAGSMAFAACEDPFTPLSGDDFKSTEAAISNGGFAVEYGHDPGAQLRRHFRNFFHMRPW